MKYYTSVVYFVSVKNWIMVFLMVRIGVKARVDLNTEIRRCAAPGPLIQQSHGKLSPLCFLSSAFRPLRHDSKVWALVMLYINKLYKKKCLSWKCSAPKRLFLSGTYSSFYILRGALSWLHKLVTEAHGLNREDEFWEWEFPATRSLTGRIKHSLSPCIISNKMYVLFVTIVL